MRNLLPIMMLALSASLISCGDDEPSSSPKLNKTSYTLHHEGTTQIDGSNLDDVTWNSSDEFVATVSGDIITGQYVGKTTVVAEGSKSAFNVEVTPVYTIYDDPILDWGASSSSIKSKYKSTYGSPVSESSTSIVFNTDNSKAPMLMYTFENDKMKSCAVLCATSTSNTLVDFLTERFVVASVNSSSSIIAILCKCHGQLADPQIDYLVALGTSSSISGFLILYTQADDARSATDTDIDALLSQFDDMLK